MASTVMWRIFEGCLGTELHTTTVRRRRFRTEGRVDRGHHMMRCRELRNLKVSLTNNLQLLPGCHRHHYTSSRWCCMLRDTKQERIRERNKSVRPKQQHDYVDDLVDHSSFVLWFGLWRTTSETSIIHGHDRRIHQMIQLLAQRYNISAIIEFGNHNL